MMSSGVEIKLFGGLKIYKDGEQILESLSNTRKTKLLISYLIMNKDKEIPHKELFELLWSGEDYANPGTALRTLLYRYRQLLEQNGIGELRDSIISRKGCYRWNSLSDVSIDLYDFERLAYKGLNLDYTKEVRKESLRCALELYEGKLFPEAEEDHWVVIRSSYYREIYINIAKEYIRFLKSEGKFDEIVKVASDVAEKAGFCQLVQNELEFASVHGRETDNDVKKYNVIDACINEMNGRVNHIQEQMEGNHSDHSAFVCDYDTFKQVYHLQRRLLLRTGETMFLSMITMQSVSEDGLLVKTCDDAVMNMLEECLKKELRMGDSICRVSDNQYAIIYPVSTFENAQGVIERVKAHFLKKLGRSKYLFVYFIRPLKNCDDI